MKHLTIKRAIWIAVIVPLSGIFVFFWFAGPKTNVLNSSNCSNGLNLTANGYTQSRDSEQRAWGSLEIIEEY